MADDHWFDALNKALVRDAPRRPMLRTAAAIAASLALTATPATEAAKKRKKGKKKGKGKGKRKLKRNQAPLCSGGACAREFVSQNDRDYCEFICTQCDGGDPRQFCIIGDPGVAPAGAYCCDEGHSCCDGQCVNTKTDPDHCGGCASACSPGKICDDGSCVCRDGLTLCGDVCRDTTRDENHCGACNQPCTGLGMECCDGDCIDVRSDRNHCGYCGIACPDSRPECCNGRCHDFATSGWTCCPGHPPLMGGCPPNRVCCTVNGSPNCCLP